MSVSVTGVVVQAVAVGLRLQFVVLVDVPHLVGSAVAGVQVDVAVAHVVVEAPGGSVRGERANFTGLVLGCIEAKFCNKNMRWTALAEIYTMHSFAPFWNRIPKTRTNMGRKEPF